MSRNHWRAGVYQWGAGLSPRGASAPRSARPRKLLRPCNQRRLHRVPFDIPLETTELIVISNDPIKELVLPKLLAASSQHVVGRVSSRALQPPHEIWQRNSGSTQHVDVIRHDDEGMQGTKPAGVGFFQLLLYNARNLRLPKIDRAIPGCVEKTVPDYERLAGGQMLGIKQALRRKAAPETPSEKYRPSRRVDVRQAAAIGSHILWCGGREIILNRSSGAQAPRGLKPAPQVKAAI
jgi:hypothetical protein